jgi:hypothetical protein
MLAAIGGNHAEAVKSFIKNDQLARRLRNLNRHRHGGDARNARKQAASDGIVDTAPIQILFAFGSGPGLIRQRIILDGFPVASSADCPAFFAFSDANRERKAAALPHTRKIRMPVSGAWNWRLVGESGRQQQEPN